MVWEMPREAFEISGHSGAHVRWAMQLVSEIRGEIQEVACQRRIEVEAAAGGLEATR
jgi:phosphotransferase system HPr-like phosphotransfer protein